ncbi:hypothetical protein [Variovorax sp.]|uniref:hypothetical protein n=1 Tax=Variovorax sp. TaxID=1871043 RepID=UPI003BAD5219
MNSVVLSGKLRVQARASRRRLVKYDERGYRIGESNPAAILTDRDVELMLELRAEGMSYAQLAEKFECSIHTVESICQFRRRSVTPARIVEDRS